MLDGLDVLIYDLQDVGALNALETGLRWVPTSPNIPTFEFALFSSTRIPRCQSSLSLVASVTGRPCYQRELPQRPWPHPERKD